MWLKLCGLVDVVEVVWIVKYCVDWLMWLKLCGLVDVVE